MKTESTIPIGVYREGHFHCRGANMCGLGEDCPYSEWDNCGAGQPFKMEPIEDEL